MSALKGHKENAIKGKQKGQCIKRERLQFPPRGEEAWTSNTVVFSCAKTADAKTTGKVLGKGNLPEAGVLLEREPEDRVEIIVVCSNPSCNFRHPPECQNYKSESGCKFGEKCVLRWWRFCCLLEEFQATRLRIPGYGTAEIQVDSTEGHEILGTEAQRSILKRNVTPRQKSGKKRVHPKVPRCYSAFCSSRARPFMLQN